MAGRQALHALVREGRKEAVRLLKPAFFLEEERPAFEFLVDHYRRHGVLPTAEAFRRAGHELAETGDAFTYWLDRLRQRAIHNVKVGFDPRIAAAARAQRSDEVWSLFDEAAREMAAVNASFELETGQELLEGVADARIADSRSGGTPTIGTGWAALDEACGGIRRQDLFVWLARRNVGKTWLLVRTMIAALDAGRSVLFVSMEMAVDEIAERVLAWRAAMNPRDLQDGRFGEVAARRLRNLATAAKAGPNFWVVHCRTTADVQGLVRELRPDLVLVDSSYVLQPMRKGLRGRTEVQAAVHEELKVDVAVAEDVPVCVTLQVNRTGKGSRDGDGIVSWSDAVEWLASIMVRARVEEGVPDRRTIDVVKNRRGPGGREFQIRWEFDPPCFDAIASDEAEAATQVVEGMR